MQIRNAFKEFFVLRSNLSKDDIKRVKTGVENYVFWPEIGSGF